MNTQLTETCGCGATFDTGPCTLIDSARSLVTAFRREHVCPKRSPYTPYHDNCMLCYLTLAKWECELIDRSGA